MDTAKGHTHVMKWLPQKAEREFASETKLTLVIEPVDCVQTCERDRAAANRRTLLPFCGVLFELVQLICFAEEEKKRKGQQKQTGQARLKLVDKMPHGKKRKTEVKMEMAVGCPRLTGEWRTPPTRSDGHLEAALVKSGVQSKPLYLRWSQSPARS